MFRIWIYTMAAVCLCVSNVTAGTKKVGDTWVLENDALKVTIHEKFAHMTVLDKAAGTVWAHEDPIKRLASEEKVRIRRAAAPPVIDGDDGEWSRDNIVWLPWVGEDGEKNLSGSARLMWDDANLYLYVRVRDNQRAFGNESAAQWREADSVEFWIDKIHVGLHLCPGKEAAVNEKDEPYDGSRMAVKLINEAHLPGYAVELAIPIQHFPVLKGGELGTRIFAAVGLNDADSKPGEPTRRCAQGYYPSTWVSDVPDSFAVAVLADSSGNAPPMTMQNSRISGSFMGRVENMRKGSGSNVLAYSVTLTRGQVKPLTLDVEFRLIGDEPAMEVALTSPAGDDIPMKNFQYPAPLYPPQPEKYFMAMVNYCNGRYLPVGDPEFRNRQLVHYGGDMPWVTVTDGTQGMMTILMTPCDACVQMQSRSDDKDRLGFPCFSWFDSKGVFGGRRVGRFVFYDKGAHVKACKIYREIAKEEGLVRKLTTDARDNPDVLKLMGAVNWWGAKGLSFVKEAHAAGMKHGLYNGRPNSKDMEEIKKLGWLIGEYDNYEDIDDSPAIERAKAPVKEHALVKQDGELMTAWISRDKDMNPTHTYMKQCTGMMLKSAKAVIPGVLDSYPYNARFLDVTTATSLKECYSPVHPCTRSQDLLNRQALLKYVSRDLGLVAGGEHGRYWGVPYLHYNEGMMGGGMYSWPAGYLRDVEKREDIKETYLKYGINPANRAPLFELVFHDCIVDYWYWGACSDYLHQVMPELTDRKTAMNILYGTPPMMWAHSHGLRWQVPEERELMLTIYRNVCKLHEIVGPQELVSHAFLTEDRMVQQSTFEDGTVTVVNFRAEPYTVTAADDKKRFTLLANDFYVHGPAIEQWRVTSADGKSHQTYIRTDEYLFVDTGSRKFEAPGISSAGQVNIIMETYDRAKIVIGAGSSLDLNVPVWNPDFKGQRALVALSAGGEPLRRIPEGSADSFSLSAPANSMAVYLLYAGKEAMIPDVTIESVKLTVNGDEVSESSVLPAGAELVAAATIRNSGLATAGSLDVNICLDGKAGIELETQGIISLRAGAAMTVRAVLPLNKADGKRRIVVNVSSKQDVSLTGRMEASAAFTGPCDPAIFPIHSSFSLKLPQGDCVGMPVEIPFDLMQPNGKKADANNMRVSFEGSLVVPAQFEASSLESAKGKLVFCVPVGVTGGSTVVAHLLSVPEGSTQVFPHSGCHYVSEDGATIDMSTYSASILDGTLSSISLKRMNNTVLPLVSHIIVSSQETGWNAETGKIEAFACEQRGPVRNVFTCTKLLNDKYRLTRKWFFYPDRMEIHSSCNPNVHTLTRAMYVEEATAVNETGKSVKMDGVGNAEDFGFRDKPSWYAVYSDQYRNVCIAVSDCSGITYWDSGQLGQISLNHGNDPVEKRVYIWGSGTDNAGFAKAAAEAYVQGITVK